MKNSKQIMEYLEKEGFLEIDEIEYNKDVTAYNFFYGFDEAEIDAAKDYANANYSEDAGEDSWNEEYFLPYLTELAADNISDMLEDLCETYELEGEFAAYELDRSRFESCEFTIVLGNSGCKLDIEKIMDELEL
jgi:hypothetical protein